MEDAVEQGFGRRVRQQRRARELSQAALGDALPSQHGTTWVSRIEAGKINPTLQDLRDLAVALHVSVDWLVNGAALDLTGLDADEKEALEELPLELRQMVAVTMLRLHGNVRGRSAPARAQRAAAATSRRRRQGPTGAAQG